VPAKMIAVSVSLKGSECINAQREGLTIIVPNNSAIKDRIIRSNPLALPGQNPKNVEHIQRLRCMATA
jgi:hypothetical protein